MNDRQIDVQIQCTKGHDSMLQWDSPGKEIHNTGLKKLQALGLQDQSIAAIAARNEQDMMAVDGCFYPDMVARIRSKVLSTRFMFV